MRGGYIVCEWSMSSLSADLLHRREVLPHMSIMLLSLFFFVLLLLVGRSGGCRARARMRVVCARRRRGGFLLNVSVFFRQLGLKS